MKSYQCRVAFTSNSQQVYQAITTEEGMKGWWTIDCDASTELGGKHTFRFERLVFNSMQVMELKPNEKVHWKSIEGWG